MVIPSRDFPLGFRRLLAANAMSAGPPCCGKSAPACAANPNRPSQYKFIPPEIRLKYPELPEGACVCKSKVCWRVLAWHPSQSQQGDRALQ